MAFVVTAITATEVTVATVATAVAELGATMSVVGAVTGSKDLMKVGGFLGLAGGATSLVSGLASAGGNIAVDAAGEGLGGSGGILGQAGDYGMNAATESGMDGITPLASDTANTVVKTADAAGPTFSDAKFDSGIGSNLDTNSSNPGSSVAGTNSTDGNSADQSFSDARFSGGGGAPYGDVSAPTDSSFASIKKWYDGQSPQVKAAVLRGGMDLAGGALGGLFRGWSEQQKATLEQNKFALQQQQLANGSAIPTINFQSNPAGIINSARSA